MKKTVLLFLFLLGSQNNFLCAGAKFVIAAASITISTAGLFGLYHWLKTPAPFEPTIENIHTLTIKQSIFFDQDIPKLTIDQLISTIHNDQMPKKVHIVADEEYKPIKKLLVEKGITTNKNDNLIFILSRGYARSNKLGENDNFIQKGGCAMAAYIPIQDNIINHAPCITFDYPDSRRHFSFAQKTDLACLKMIYQKTLQTNPDAHIILVGDCRGAKAILSFVAQQPKNITAIVLLSPFMSARELTEQVARNYLSWLPYSSDILYNFFKLWFPNYNEQEDNLIEYVSNIKKDLPIFIAHRKGDKLVADQHIANLVHHLRNTGHSKVHFLAVEDDTAPHSKLTPNKKLQFRVNEFFYAYNLPHNGDILTV